MAGTGELIGTLSRSVPTAGQRAFEWCALLSFAIHLAFLVAVSRADGSRHEPPAVQRLRPFQLVDPTTALPRMRGSLTKLTPVAMPAAAPASAARAPAEASSEPDLVDATVSPQPSAVPAPSAPATPFNPDAFADEDSYLPRQSLVVGPLPLSDVELPYPKFEGDTGHYVGRVTLYIDEAGLVQRVRVDAGDLPPALEDVVRREFMTVRFQPGQADGRAVRSRIRVEVRFDATPLKR